MKFPSRIWLLGLGLAVIGTLCWWANRPRSEGNPLPTENSAVASPAFAAALPIHSSTTALVSTNGVRLHPLAVSQQTSSHEWTAADGMTRETIQQIAHNEMEERRLLEENARIKRRQLVYRKDTAAAVLQRARLSGEPVRQLTIPGFDGQELQVTVERADLEPSWQSGTFTGRLADKPNSLVTLAFKFGREAFTVLSPEDSIYLQGQPRESGEIILPALTLKRTCRCPVAIPSGQPTPFRLPNE
ncbi:MAG: hypothetical protein QM813_01905 [Verrucomicrobiota bacterium]